MLIRLFDIVLSVFALVFLLPVLVILILLIGCIDGLPIFFLQQRSGKKFKIFMICKFRTMLRDTEDEKGVTVGSKDKRITSLGKILRKYKLDELPQFWNVLQGSMSIVGSRPQVPYYTEKFNDLYSEILKIKPGIFSPSAIVYSNEEEVLAQKENPITYYENILIPLKAKMDIEMVRQFGNKYYFYTLCMFFKKIIQSITATK